MRRPSWCWIRATRSVWAFEHEYSRMSKAPYDVAIVGTGIVGAACADELTRRGLRVAVIGEDIVGSGATAAGMGHIVVMDDSEAQVALTRYSQQLWREVGPGVTRGVGHGGGGPDLGV